MQYLQLGILTTQKDVEQHQQNPSPDSPKSIAAYSGYNGTVNGKRIVSLITQS